MKKGFSLIELMISATIIGLVVTLGISAYSKGSDKQSAKNAADRIISVLSENQKKANIGHEDCTGRYLGQEISFNSGNNKINSVSICSTSPGTSIETDIEDIIFTSTISMLFNPLSQGVTDAGIITYTGPNGSTYSIQVDSSGTIEYLGAQN